MIQSIFILNQSGDILIEKHYRGLLNRNLCEFFWDEVSKSSSPSEVLPVITTPKHYLIHIQSNSLYFLGVVNQEVSPLMVLEFLHRTTEIFGQYFENVTENVLRENFVTVYQLLDELMDNGIPFTTEPNSLVEIIPTSNIVNKVVGSITGQSRMTGAVGDGSLSNTPWRKTGVRYPTNEIYFDIVEEIDCIIDPNGTTVSNEVSGEVQVVSKLSGMPDLTLVFSNPGILDDVSFHPCVRYQRYEQQKVISFVPPDGTFKLMNYRVKGQLQSPMYVKPQISFNQAGGRVNIMVGTKSVQGKSVEDVIITIPFPKMVSTVTLSANYGQVQTDDITKICKWMIGKLPKDRTPMLEGSVALAPGGPIPESNPVISVQFKMTMYTSSGLKVDSLAVHNEGYKPFKGVRSLTRAGKFHVRS